MLRWSVLLVLLFACGGEGESQLPVQTTQHDAGIDAFERAICDLCTTDADCASGICKMYGDGYRKCSTTCTPYEAAPQCIGSSPGYCNGMGYCGCTFMPMPADAGVDDGPRDAPEPPPMDAGMAPIDGL